MEVIEKTRWEGDKTVGVEIVRTRMKRGMEKREFEDKQVWKDQKRHQMEEKRDCCCGDSEKVK